MKMGGACDGWRVQEELKEKGERLDMIKIHCITMEFSRNELIILYLKDVALSVTFILGYRL